MRAPNIEGLFRIGPKGRKWESLCLLMTKRCCDLTIEKAEGADGITCAPIIFITSLILDPG